jgi:hypothetical protein
VSLSLAACILVAYPLQGNVRNYRSAVSHRAVLFLAGVLFRDLSAGPLAPVELVIMGWIDSRGANRTPGDRVTRAEIKLTHPLQQPATTMLYSGIVESTMDILGPGERGKVCLDKRKIRSRIASKRAGSEEFIDTVARGEPWVAAARGSTVPYRTRSCGSLDAVLYFCPCLS